MSSGERPIGAAKGKQSDTEALCQHPPPRTPPVGMQMTQVCHGLDEVCVVSCRSSVSSDVNSVFAQRLRQAGRSVDYSGCAI